MANSSDLIEYLNSAPESNISREVRPRLKLLFTSLDQLLFLDDRAEVAVDREALIRIVTDEDLTPPALRDVVLLETAKHLGRRIRSFRDGQRIPWRDGEKYGLPTKSPSLEELRSMGLDPADADGNLEATLRTRLPEIPDFWIEPDSKILYDRVIANLLTNQTVWDCLVRNLGFWAALNVVGTSVMALILLIGGTPWQVVLKWIIVFYWPEYCLLDFEVHRKPPVPALMIVE